MKRSFTSLRNLTALHSFSCVAVCCDGAEADEDDDDAVYQLTPKGIACLALLRTGLVESIEDPRIDGFWELFQADMDALGYTQEVEE